MSLNQGAEQFLKAFAVFYAQNPNLPISSDTIYHNLTNYGLTKEEVNNSDLIEESNQLLNAFSSAKHLRVFHTDRQRNFIQFQNRRSDGFECVKMYMSFPKEYFVEACQKIFGFIDQNNIETISKTSMRLRSDSVVLRIKDFNEAKKVMDFINSDPSLTSKAKSVSPFSLTQGKIGIGYDRALSYNETLCNLMSLYLSDLRNKNILNQASMDSFSSFIDTYYKDTFINCSKLDQLLEQPFYKDSAHRFYSNGEEVNNYEQVVRLINFVAHGNFDLSLYENYYKGCCDKNRNNQMITYYEQACRNIAMSKASNNIVEVQQNVEDYTPPTKVLLDEYIKYASTKYGPGMVINYLNEYLRGNINGITRDNNFRDKFGLMLTPQIVINMMGQNPNQYITEILSSPQNEAGMEEQNKERFNFDLFCNGCVETIKKYGRGQLMAAINNAMGNNFAYFTNGSCMYRDQMIQNIDCHKIIDYCVTYLKMQNYALPQNADVVSLFCDSMQMMMEQERPQVY